MNRKVAIDFAEQTIVYANRPFSKSHEQTNERMIERTHALDRNKIV